MNPHDSELLRSIRLCPGSTKRALMTLTGLTFGQVRDALERLSIAGRVESRRQRWGRGGPMRYWLAGQVADEPQRRPDGLPDLQDAEWCPVEHPLCHESLAWASRIEHTRSRDWLHDRRRSTDRKPA